MTAAVRVELHAGYLRVVELDHHADFHLRWLRHNCDRDRHPTTGERTIDSSELPDDLAAATAVVDTDALVVTWAHDGRTSRYPLAWLRQHAYAIDRPAVPPPPSDPALLELDGTPGPEAVADALLARVAERGAAIVRGASANPEAETEPWIAALEARGYRVIPTHFGRIEDLRTDNTTNANTDQLGYTDAGIGLHTDQPFLDEPPRYQMLQGIRAADTGGESLLADGEAAFRYFANHDRAAADLLLATPVRFHRKQQSYERELRSPIVWFDAGRFRIRSSYFTLAPFQLPFDQMSAWYSAHDRFGRILRDPAHGYRFQLRPGDALLYDNHRMVHGRTAFSGKRWVRGIYFEPPT
jgi:gamma-butyrobetaine dioxygenase